ncbi:MAG: peptide ABC transporter substrate-binding protein [Chloroflexi bacterium]|nr:peptide ABC transporter substrate-binding protein [Chloroflexota bacterium]
MKLHLRWQIMLAALGFVLILAILSFQVQTANLCVTRVPAAGGVFAEGVVGAPQYLNPLLSDPNPVDRELVSLVFDGLTAVNESGHFIPALAEKWEVSEDGRTIRFTLHDDAVWHDGEPVTATDVVFSYSLLQEEAFPTSPALKALWQSVSINQISDTAVEFILSEPYAPFLEATTRGILPAHLLADVPAAEIATHPFNQMPVGTGPWMVKPDQNWPQTYRLQLEPNPLNWREGTLISTLEFRFYPDDKTVADALAAAEIQAINSVAAATLPQVAALPDSRLFTAESPRYTMLLFNLTNSAVSEAVEIRQALAYALDREQMIDEALNGQGVPFEGPYLPSSWAYNPAQLSPYTHDPVTATQRLDAAGWTLPEGQTIRQKDGTPLTLTLLTLAVEPFTSQAETIAAQWAEVGVQTHISATTSIDDLRNGLEAGLFDVALVEVAPNADPDLYDFWSQEAIIRGQNYAGWNNRRASEALESARQVWGEAERRPYYDTFLRLFNTQLPALTLYRHVYTYGLSQEVEQAEIGKIQNPRDRYTTFADWLLLYRDVTISCPAAG